MVTNKNTILTKWANPKKSSIQIIIVKKFICDLNPTGEMVEEIINGDKTLTPLPLFRALQEMSLAQSKRLIEIEEGDME
tara:strand:+ start:142 stop:378 length:237 start_codon:yes stop_codon:yes gene_type:complete